MTDLTFGDLCDDILSVIFKWFCHINPKDITTLRLVCKYWRDICSTLDVQLYVRWDYSDNESIVTKYNCFRNKIFLVNEFDNHSFNQITAINAGEICIYTSGYNVQLFNKLANENVVEIICDNLSIMRFNGMMTHCSLFNVRKLTLLTHILTTYSLRCIINILNKLDDSRLHVLLIVTKILAGTITDIILPPTLTLNILNPEPFIGRWQSIGASIVTDMTINYG